MQHLVDSTVWVGCAAYAQRSCTNEATTKSPPANTVITTSCHHPGVWSTEYVVRNTPHPHTTYNWMG